MHGSNFLIKDCIEFFKEPFLISCLISAFNAARSTVGAMIELVGVEGGCCSSLEKDLTVEIFELQGVGELEAVFELALGRAGNSC